MAGTCHCRTRVGLSCVLRCASSFRAIPSLRHVFCQWPGYQSAYTHLGFEELPFYHCSYSRTTKHSLTLNEFAFRLAEKLQLWLLWLTRQWFEGTDKDWELGVACLPPLDELFIVAVAPRQGVDEEGMWGISLVRQPSC